MIFEIQKAQANLPELIERACAGEEVIIARDAEPMVRMIPVAQSPPKRVFGSMKGRFIVPAECAEPIPDDELEAWSQ